MKSGKGIWQEWGRDVYTVLVGRSTGRPKRRQDNIKTNLKDNERVWTGFIWLRAGTSDGLS
jgi:uncharacterized membrane protein